MTSILIEFWTERETLLSEIAIMTEGDWIGKLREHDLDLSNLFLSKIEDCKTLRDDARQILNEDSHIKIIVRGIRAAMAFSNKSIGVNLLSNLLSNNPFAAFAEISVYDWFARCSIRFTPQIPLNASEILGNNGATLDGKLELGGAYFDVKAFGFNAALAELLREKIQQNFPDKYVSINGSWDILIDDFGNLLQNVHIICEKLNKDGIYRLGPLRVHMTEKKVVNISSRGSSPYLLAKENALFAFKDANQFVTNAPFALIYVSHPWYSPGGIGDDFANQDTIFTRSFARRAFIQFSQDQRSLGEICGKADASQTLGTASRLLSAIFFFNAWPREADKNQVKKFQTWAYFNPRAKHPFPRCIIGALRADNIHGLRDDDFVDDDY